MIVEANQSKQNQRCCFINELGYYSLVGFLLLPYAIGSYDCIRIKSGCLCIAQAASSRFGPQKDEEEQSIESPPSSSWNIYSTASHCDARSECRRARAGPSPRAASAACYGCPGYGSTKTTSCCCRCLCPVCQKSVERFPAYHHHLSSWHVRRESHPAIQ